MRVHTLFGCLVLLVGIAASGVSNAHGKNPDWSPRLVAIKLPAGTGRTLEVTLTPDRTVKDVELRLIGPHEDLVTVTPSRFKQLKRGVPVRITLQVRTPPGATPGQKFLGMLVVGKQEKKHFRQLLHTPLPVAVLARKNADDYSELTVYPEIGSPLQMGMKLKDGTRVDLVGGKDPQGNATSLDGLIFQDEAGRTDFLIDESGRPSHISLPDGSTIRFTWESNTRALAEIITAEGDTQANVSLDLSSPQALVENLETMEAAVTSIAPLRQSKDAWTAGSEKHNLAVQQAQLAQVLALSSLANIDVQVTANGQPVPDAVVNGLADPGPLQVSYPLFFTNAGGGAYRGYFVTDPAVIPLQQAAQKCVSILETVETSCSVAEPVAVGMLGGGCILLAAGIATVNPAAADKVLFSCESVFADVAAVCAVGGQPNLAGACGAIFAVPALFHPGTISLRVSATKNGITGSRTVSTSSSGGTVNIAIELPLPLCSIMSVSTNPVDPAPFQSYVANVVTTCGGAGDSITMAISGTDGYSDSVTCAATGSCQLAVPGAEEGIVDTVTVTTSSGESRVIQLVF